MPLLLTLIHIRALFRPLSLKLAARFGTKRTPSPKELGGLSLSSTRSIDKTLEKKSRNAARETLCSFPDSIIYYQLANFCMIVFVL